MPERLIEYLNPQGHTIQLSAPDKSIIKIPAHGKVVLSDWYMTYCPKYLRVVREVGSEAANLTPKPLPTQAQYKRNKRQPLEPRTAQKQRLKIQNKSGARPAEPIIKAPPARSTAKAQPISSKPISEGRKPIVGRPARGLYKDLLQSACQNNPWTISNNIGIGILSFNRLDCLQRLIASIRRFTDLSRTTVFVSDESTDPAVRNWLKDQTDIVVLTDQPRLGIAGNSNRLLRCLSRFRWAFLLNDDVEILNSGWAEFYRVASTHTGIHHFCYHQVGVYSAKRGPTTNVAGYHVETIREKPHGAVMFFTNTAFEKVGYFDEQFGLYGMEHVDWSNRISLSGIQLPGFHDVLGSERYFKIYGETSSVSNAERGPELQKSRELYQQLSSPERIRVEPTPKSEVPSISIVIPLRNIDRQGAAETIINAMRGQLFPNVDIVLVEQDAQSKFKLDNVLPCRYFLAANRHPSQPFTKALAFNLGVAKAKYNKVILQDADITVPANYSQKIYRLLDQHDGVHIGSRVIYLTQDASERVIRTGIISEESECERAVDYFEGGSLACIKKRYFSVGGFNEIFEGYGVEDCDFFERLKAFSSFYNVRTEDFIHLWHGRTPGWDLHHRRNRKIADQIRKQYTLHTYVASLVNKIKTTYPAVAKELNL